jgi:hypothetical protein
MKTGGNRTASERTFRTGKSEALAMPDSSAGNREGVPQRSASMDLPPHAPSIEGSTATRRRAARDRAFLGSIPNSSSHTRMSAAQKAGP